MMTAETWYQQGSTTTVNGLPVFFQTAGQGSPMLCLHGFPTSSWDFAPMWDTLFKRFKVLAPDLIGLGRSAKPKGPLTVGMQADMVEGLAIQSGIEQAHLLAHDLGDTVAQELLARQKAGTGKVNWQSCIFSNGGLFPETHRPRFIQKVLISPLGPLVASLMQARTFNRNMINVFSPKYPPSDAFLKSSWALITENRGKSMIPKLIRYMAERRRNRSRWVAPLAEPVVPLRLINGVLDPVSGQHMVDRYREIVDKPDVVTLEDVGHYPHVETPERVLAAVFSFHDLLP